MKTAEELRRALRGLDRRGYPAYKSLAGAYRFADFCLFIDHVQGDPFAAPSSLRVEAPYAAAGFPERFRRGRAARTALADFLTRQMAAQFERCSFKAKGSGKSGLMSITRCGQEVLERSACEISGGTEGADGGRAGGDVRGAGNARGAEGVITVRFHVGFPAFGRTINAGELERILFDFLPVCVKRALFHDSLDARQVEAAVHLAEDQEALRARLREEGLVAFVANGAILPRRSGVSDKPLAGAVPFASPVELERSFDLPHAGRIAGMAVPRGITLIVGGGYHGKSTLLEALQSGVYNHIAGDGREFVLADDTAVKLRAEDGRCIRNVDISLFINDLPNGKDTAAFSTENASGSTSQAAGVVEGMEAGCRLFLIDEDTSATNFMVRDEFMQQVISREKEPITPFLERARGLYEQAGASTILVAGSSGAFFHIADRVIQMDCYRPVDITERVRGLCAQREAPAMGAPAFRVPRGGRTMPTLAAARAGDARDGRGGRDGGRRHGHGDGCRGYDAGRDERGQGGGRRGRDGRGDRDGGARGRERLKVRSQGRDAFSLGKENVDVRFVEQIADPEQTAALAHLLRYGLERFADGTCPLTEVVERLFAVLEREGWAPFCGSFVPCGLAKPRKQEVFAALNRFRGGMGGGTRGGEMDGAKDSDR
ncbi:isopentenyl-diphosphate delta-isomerase [Rubneribacter badeniensis]|uniref:Isopentenyl-diphosphate delta-isomerase n=1 Tax=Rubneribacter badeniensis TaxID=2070688 RepID=A0A2K2U446_9ACTN|nr:ABC-ATPase domain-containing protein [Rubneribacter badeniensis]PNV65113.1 isopentenyl-diphosphate delta-isomerase [Rubneribacter badeniensis]